MKKIPTSDELIDIAAEVYKKLLADYDLSAVETMLVITLMHDLYDYAMTRQAIEEKQA